MWFVIPLASWILCQNGMPRWKYQRLWWSGSLSWRCLQEGFLTANAWMSDSLKIPEGGDFAIQGAFCVPEEEIIYHYVNYALLQKCANWYPSFVPLRSFLFFFYLDILSTALCALSQSHCRDLSSLVAKVAPGVFRSFSPSRRGNWHFGAVETHRRFNRPTLHGRGRTWYIFCWYCSFLLKFLLKTASKLHG